MSRTLIDVDDDALARAAFVLGTSSKREQDASGDFWEEDGQSLAGRRFGVVSTRGSHQKLHHDDGRVVIVPLHRELARGTLASILRQARLTPDEFKGLL
jgi:predicted RNA binding protein YcfA (HicA-like mRNA interferase family)